MGPRAATLAAAQAQQPDVGCGSPPCLGGAGADELTGTHRMPQSNPLQHSQSHPGSGTRGHPRQGDGWGHCRDAGEHGHHPGWSRTVSGVCCSRGLRVGSSFRGNPALGHQGLPRARSPPRASLPLPGTWPLLETRWRWLLLAPLFLPTCLTRPAGNLQLCSKNPV